MEEKKHHSVIRTIYLYLFSLLGLIFLTIGAIRFIDMGLKAFVFTKAEEEQRITYKQPPLPYSLERIEEISTQVNQTLTDSEVTAIRTWLEDYNQWEESADKIDPVTSRRHRDASINLAMILVGLPLYLYHWAVIKKDTRERMTA